MCTAWCQWDFFSFFIYEWLFTRMLFAVVIRCFMIRVNVWWVYLAPQNIPCAISVDTWQSSYIKTVALNEREADFSPRQWTVCSGPPVSWCFMDCCGNQTSLVPTMEGFTPTDSWLGTAFMSRLTNALWLCMPNGARQTKLESKFWISLLGDLI